MTVQCIKEHVRTYAMAAQVPMQTTEAIAFLKPLLTHWEHASAMSTTVEVILRMDGSL